MKRIAISVIVSCVLLGSIWAQKTAVDNLFDKYAYKDGFTTVFISKDMFRLFASIKGEDAPSEELMKAIAGLKDIKILTSETPNVNINFFNEIGNQIPFEEYTNLMVVKEEDQEIRMMIKEKNGAINEFLMLGGGEDNILISITGDIDLKSIIQLSQTIDDLENLKKLKGAQ